jgi:hypothetical protein
MPDNTMSQPQSEKSTSPAAASAGDNPRNRPIEPAGSVPPQPDAPPRSPVEEQQDQQPLDPKPLLHGQVPRTGHPFAEKNG